MTRTTKIVGWLLTIILAMATPAAASWSPNAQSPSTQSPNALQLPNGFRPEGITIGAWPTAYFGSMGDGTIYQVNLLTGKGRVLAQGTGTMSLGMKIDHRAGCSWRAALAETPESSTPIPAARWPATD